MVRKIRAKLVLQLRAEGLSGRAIAASQQMSRKSVTAVLDAADAAGVACAYFSIFRDQINCFMNSFFNFRTRTWFIKGDS